MAHRNPSRYWILTIPRASWSPPESLLPALTFLKGQLEVGAGGFEHWQLVACFKTAQRLPGVKKLFAPTAHAEPTRSEAAFEYVHKEDTRVPDTQFEFGKKPIRRNSAPDWESVWDSAKRGDLLAIPADIRVRSYHTLKRIAVDHLRPAPIERVCHVFCGRTGTGKSRRAWEEASMEAYPKDPNTKFWDGYSTQQHVVIDEFRGAISISHLLRWLDRYPVVVEVKGSSVALSAQVIWITSNLHPLDWYPDLDQETKDALLRRLNITVFA